MRLIASIAASVFVSVILHGCGSPAWVAVLAGLIALPCIYCLSLLRWLAGGVEEMKICREAMKLSPDLSVCPTCRRYIDAKGVHLEGQQLVLTSDKGKRYRLVRIEDEPNENDRPPIDMTGRK